jgi:outer membrane protein OmpA-like peptidoglycan-associated protein
MIPGYNNNMKRYFSSFFFFLSIGVNAQVLNHVIYFESGVDKLMPIDSKWIDSVSSVLQRQSQYTIQISAHCDSDGNENENLLLSQRRADVIKDAFLKKEIISNNIKVEALGEKLAGQDANPSAKAKERRAEIIITIPVPDVVHDVSIEEPVEVVEDPAVIQGELSSEKLEVGKTLILKNLNFAGGTAMLLKESIPVLKELVKLMKDNPSLEIEIRGHVCCADDMPLSELRAEKVYNYLKDNGIKKSRMKFRGYSHDYPLASEVTEEGRIANRRVEIKILKID